MKKQILILGFAMLLSVAGAFAQHVDGGTTGPLTWELTGTGDNLALTISGAGAMPDYEFDLMTGYCSMPWYDYRESIETVVIESGVTTIGDIAFTWCDVLMSVTIPNSITTIGNSAFAGCSALESVTLPNGVTTIGIGAFNSCSAFKSFTIPDGVTTIGDGAFGDCFALESITIPNNVTTIGEGAFSRCESLEIVNFDAIKCTKMGNEYNPVFADCPTLTTVNIGDKVTMIPDYAFYIYIWHHYGNDYDNALNSINFSTPSSVTTIGERAFWHCTVLESITIPNSVTTIGDEAFSYCSALTSVTIGNSVTTIGDEAFRNCALESVTIPNGVATIGNGAFRDCIALESITIPNSVTTIGNSTFYRCDALTSVTIGNSVTTIGVGAFYWCDALTSVTIGNSVTTIGNEAFRVCLALKSITLPNSITTIGNEAFASCHALKSITNLNLVPIKIEYNVFENVTQSACTLKVPTSAVSAYQKAEVWQEFNIVGGGFLVNPKVDALEHGYVTGNDLYEGRATATVTAIAYDGYRFVNWTINGAEVSKDNPYIFTVTEDIELVANFEEDGTGIVAPPSPLEGGDVRIYPNPTTGELTICDVRCAICDVEIFDVMGHTAHVETLRATSLQSEIGNRTSEIEMNISHLPAGVYFLRITTANGTVTQKVVKR